MLQKLIEGEKVFMQHFVEPREVKSNFFGEDLTILLKSCFQE